MIRLMLAGMSLFATVALADDCACDRYLQFISEYSLASDVAAIGTAALHPDGQRFDVERQRAFALLTRVRSDVRIPDSCRGYVLSKLRLASKYGAVLGVSHGDVPTAFDMQSGYQQSLVDVYNSGVSAFVPCQRPYYGADTSAYVSCLRSKGPSGYQAYSNYISGTSSEEIAHDFSVLGHQLVPQDVELLKAYNQALNSGSSEGLMAWAAGPGRKLSTDQFLSVVQMFGWQLNTGYNYARTDLQNDASKGIVSVDQLIRSMHTNTMYLITGYSDPAYSIADFQGVCRDVAVLQAQMLRAGGFKNSYTVAYRSAADGHVDVITQDPHDPLKLYTLNWDGRAEHVGLDGGKALFQGSGSGIPDYSTTYFITDANGKGVTTVQSEMGKFLTEAAGGRVDYWDPAARADSSIMAVSLAPDAKGRVQLRAVYGSDGNGASYVGAAGDVSWGEKTHFPGKFGVFVGEQLRPGDVYQTGANGSTAIAYGQLDQHAVTSPIKVGNGLTATIDARVTAGGALTLVTSGPDHRDKLGDNLGGDGDERIGAEVRLDQTALAGRLNARYAAGGTVMIGPVDVRSGDVGNFVPLPVHGYVRAGATLKAGDVNLVGEALLVVDQLGARDKVEAGVVGRKVAATVYESGRVTDGTALIQDGSIRRVGVSLTATPTKHLKLNLSGEVPIEGKDSISAARIYGTAAVLF